MKTLTSGLTRGSYFGNVGHMLIILSEKELVALILVPLEGIIKTNGVLDTQQGQHISPTYDENKVIYQDVTKNIKMLVSISSSLYC